MGNRAQTFNSGVTSYSKLSKRVLNGSTPNTCLEDTIFSPKQCLVHANGCQVKFRRLKEVRSAVTLSSKSISYDKTQNIRLCRKKNAGKTSKAYRQTQRLSPPLLNMFGPLILAVCFTCRDYPVPEVTHCRSPLPCYLQNCQHPASPWQPCGSACLVALTTFYSSKPPSLVRSPLCATGAYNPFFSSAA